MQACASTKKRNDITLMLAAFLANVRVTHAESLLPAARLLCNDLSDAADGVELGMSEALVSRAIAEVAGCTEADVAAAAKSAGDLGAAAAALVKPAAAAGAPVAAASLPSGGALLSLQDVFHTLLRVARTTGKDSQLARVALVRDLLVSAASGGPHELATVVRWMVGRMRINLGVETVIAALAQSAMLPGSRTAGADAPTPAVLPVTKPSDKEFIDCVVAACKDAYGRHMSLESIVSVVRNAAATGDGSLRAASDWATPAVRVLEGSKHLTVYPGYHAAPMLARPATSFADALELLHGEEEADGDGAAAASPASTATSTPAAGAAGAGVACDWKYDGERAVIHIPGAAVKAALAGGDGMQFVRVFSRNGEDSTAKHAAVAAAALRAVAGNRDAGNGVILDGEVVAVDAASGRILPFQVLSTLRRKGDAKPAKAPAAPKPTKKGKGTAAAAAAAPLPPSTPPAPAADPFAVRFLAFDCLYTRGGAVTHLPFTERRKLLHALVGGDEYVAPLQAHQAGVAAGTGGAAGAAGGSTPVGAGAAVQMSRCALAHDEAGIQAAMTAAMGEGCEGLILKAPGAPYTHTRRGTTWIKLKKDYLDGLGDSFDCAVVGAWWGKGKRASVLGSYLLAVRGDPDDGTSSSSSSTGSAGSGPLLQTLCRVGTGLTDAQLAGITARLAGRAVPTPDPCLQVAGALAKGTGKADLWFPAATAEVWEVLGADLTVSPVHTAGSSDGGPLPRGRGIALRFPRLLRERPDKALDGVTRATAVLRAWKASAQHHGAAAATPAATTAGALK